MQNSVQAEVLYGAGLYTLFFDSGTSYNGHICPYIVHTFLYTSEEGITSE